MVRKRFFPFLFMIVSKTFAALYCKVCSDSDICSIFSSQEIPLKAAGNSKTDLNLYQWSEL